MVTTSQEKRKQRQSTNMKKKGEFLGRATEREKEIHLLLLFCWLLLVLGLFFDPKKNLSTERS
jgi:hypothetical protein